MGKVSVLPDVTINQLLDEANKRWPEKWDSDVERTTVLLMIKRSTRPDVESHGFFVDHIHPVFSVFYRPRNEAPLLKKDGFNHLDASFQFINIASSDLGKWMTKFVGELAFEKYDIDICPIPLNYNIPMKRQFETIKTVCFKDSELQKIENLYLSMPPNSLVGKSFLSIPEKDVIEPEEAKVPVIVKPKENKEPAKESNEKSTIPDKLKEIATGIVQEAQVPTKEPEIPKITPEPEDAPSDTPEGEFRRLVKWMISLGHEPSEIMEKPEFQEVSERAIAAGVNTWELFLKLTS